ncbi:hypothetical protein OSTOST_14851 [Ostertagia ostertagi]
MSSSGDGLKSEPPPGTSPPSASGEQPVPSVSEPSSETADHVMVSTEIADTEQARSATIGHAVASTDLPMHTPDTHVPTTDVDISTVSGHSTGCEFSSDELLASDVDMRSSTDPDQPHSSPMQTSSVSASSAGSQQSSLDQPLLGSATEAPSGSRFRAGWQTDTTQLSFAQSFEDSQKPTTSTEGFSSRVQDPSTRPQPPRGTSRRPARATTTAPLPRRGTSTTRGARGQRRLLRSRSCVAEKPSSSKTQELPEDTPEGFWHYLIDRHPWAEYVKPRQLRMHEIASQQVTNELSEDIYRPVPTPGYLKLKFVRSLFPRVTPINGLVTASLPFLELPSLEDAVVFRGNADNIIQAALRGHVQPEPQPPEGRQAAKGAWTSVVAPRYLKADRQDATMRMGRIFNAASSALAAYVSMDDDKETHRVTATVPSLSAYPLRIEFLLSGMSTEAGWSRHRPVDVWIMGAFFFVRMTVEAVIHVREMRQLRIQLRAYPWSHRSLLRATNHVGRLAGNSAFLEVCVKLGKLSSSTIPAYEAVTHMRLFSDIPTGSMAHKIMDAVYGLTPLGCLNEDEKHLWPLARCIVPRPPAMQWHRLQISLPRVLLVCSEALRLLLAT